MTSDQPDMATSRRTISETLLMGRASAMVYESEGKVRLRLL